MLNNLIFHFFNYYFYLSPYMLLVDNMLPYIPAISNILFGF